MSVTFDFGNVERMFSDLEKTSIQKQEKAVMTAAEHMKGEFQQKAADTFHKSGRGTGSLMKSVKVGKFDGVGVEIFPRGKHQNGERNETVGMVQEYGRSNMAGTAWWSSTIEANRSKALEIIKETVLSE